MVQVPDAPKRAVGGTGPLRVLLEASVVVVNADDLVVVIPGTFLVMSRSAADAQ